MSSLLATRVRFETFGPVYTASNVSKVLPMVSKVTGVAEALVQQNQSEWPPGLSAWSGSPGSLVAVLLLSDSEPEGPLSEMQLAKKSLRQKSAESNCSRCAERSGSAVSSKV